MPATHAPEPAREARSAPRLLVFGLVALLGACAGGDPGRGAAPAEAPQDGPPKSAPEEPAGVEPNPMETQDDMPESDEEWRQKLTPEQYRVLRQAGTERPFGEIYEEFKQQGEGVYRCAGCGAKLFSSNEKFDSHCGWPSFYDPADAENVVTRDDSTLGMTRTEVLCARCGGHLGHVFKGEGFPTPTDLRYCINGVALEFVPAEGGGGE